MRHVYQRELEEVGCDLARMTVMAGAALRAANTALLSADLYAARAVIAGDQELDVARAARDNKTFQVVACQQPVAGDLRLLLAALQISANAERMGDLAVHVAKVACLRFPQCAVPEGLRGTIEAMGDAAVQLADQAAEAVEARDLYGARAVEKHDDTIDRLHRRLYAEITDSDQAWPVRTAIDLAQLDRCYERFADHAVLMARRLEFVVTGTADA
jgi:phosphate transport system protein